MFGSNDTGTIALEASNDNGLSWTSIWSQTGNQGNQWNTVNLNLATYVGSGVQLRFNRVTGGTWQADIALDAISLTIGSTGGTGCTGGIASFPYAESFESSFGAWTQAAGDDLNWIRDSGGTPSNNTGPSSGADGAFYVYVEASGNGTGFPDKQAILNSPCFDLNSASQATFSFQYHMFGSTNAGSIDLEASNDNGTTWTSIWNQTGNQGNQWNTVTLDLAAYVGEGLQLRFNRVTGGTWQADVAIDDISLTTGGGTSNNCAAGDLILTITLDNYPEETAWTLQTGGSTVASNSYSTANPDGSTVVENINGLSSGDYTFTITDSFGDGICCGFGNGSYTLESSEGVIVSGGDFGASDVTNFCVDDTKSQALRTQPLAGADNNLFKVYPNPAETILHIDVQDQKIDNIKVFSMLGMLVNEIQDSGIRSIDVTNYKTGTYFIRITAGDTTITRRFIKK